jgi:hypothetical protein
VQWAIRHFLALIDLIARSSSGIEIGLRERAALEQAGVISRRREWRGAGRAVAQRAETAIAPTTGVAWNRYKRAKAQLIAGLFAAELGQHYYLVDPAEPEKSRGLMEHGEGPETV